MDIWIKGNAKKKKKTLCVSCFSHWQFYMLKARGVDMEEPIKKLQNDCLAKSIILCAVLLSGQDKMFLHHI